MLSPGWAEFSKKAKETQSKMPQPLSQRGEISSLKVFELVSKNDP